MRIVHFETKAFSTYRLHFPKLEFALEYPNTNFLHAAYISYVLHKTAIANKLNHAETRTSVKIQVSEIPSGICAKLRTVAASNNRVHMP